MTSVETMKAWQVAGTGRMELCDVPVPRAGTGEVAIRVEACGVCRTDLHVIDGDLAPHRDRVVPGHEVVGKVVARDADLAGGPAIGDRVGVPWLRSTCGVCRWCRTGRENLCEQSSYTGWDADGGYAEYVVAPAAYVYAIPDGVSPNQAAPLLCAGIIGYRALLRAELPPGGRLGIFGYGASGHLTGQLATALGAELHVVTRDPAARALALELGAVSAAAHIDDLPPLDAAIVFAPAGEVAAEALAALGPAGHLSLAGIHMSAIPSLDYQRHLFRERSITTVTSNTRADGEEFLRLAGRLGVRAEVSTYRLDQANGAIDDLRSDRVRGAAVLTVPPRA